MIPSDIYTYMYILKQTQIITKNLAAIGQLT